MRRILAHVPNFRLTLEYDGTDFGGWQVQPAHQARRTLQGTLEDAIERVTGQRVRVVGSGRTDAGVHAEGQVANARIETELGPEALRRALGGVLPADLAVLLVAVAPEAFHARRDAISKRYRYSVWNGEQASPLRRRRAAWFRPPLELEPMRRAALDLAGEHDFSSFQATGSSVRTTVRSLSGVEVGGETRGEIELTFQGSGFLRHMVRNLVGTLLEVGTGRRWSDSMPTLLAARDRSLAGPTAPAAGLSLVRVDYGDFPENSGS